MRQIVLNFAFKNNFRLVIRKARIITFKSENNRSQIDYFMIKKKELDSCKICKTIP